MSIDELSLCDPEIRAVFKGDDSNSYFIGTPIMAQLVKEIRLLREEIANFADTLFERGADCNEASAEEMTLSEKRAFVEAVEEWHNEH